MRSHITEEKHEVNMAAPPDPKRNLSRGLAAGGNDITGARIAAKTKKFPPPAENFHTDWVSIAGLVVFRMHAEVSFNLFRLKIMVVPRFELAENVLNSAWVMDPPTDIDLVFDNADGQGPFTVAPFSFEGPDDGGDLVRVEVPVQSTGFFTPANPGSPDGAGTFEWTWPELVITAGDEVFSDTAVLVTGEATALESPCPADLDGDGAVGGSDLAILLGQWGFSPGSPADLTGDGFVNGADLAIMLGQWGPCPDA